MNKKLLIIASEHISQWMDKGEVVDLYYNPGNFFEEVHLILVNIDKPDAKLVQKMVGEAKLFIHNYPEPENFFRNTFGWRPFLIRSWANGVLNIVQDINPDLIRCYGAHLNTFLASIVKKKLGIKYLVSLHINPDENQRRGKSSLKQQLIHWALKSIEKIGLRSADLVLPVYKPIVPYLEKLGVKKYEVCYNSVNGKSLSKKEDYSIKEKTRCIYIGNLSDQKFPINIIKAVDKISDIELTVLGRGPKETYLKEYVSKNQLESKVHFISSIPNDELCSTLKNYDIVVLHTEHYELSKVMIESFLVGMPLIVNKLKSGLQVPELLEKNICIQVENTPEAYQKAIELLAANDTMRQSLGNNARDYIGQLCDPNSCSKKIAEIYKSHLAS